MTFRYLLLTFLISFRCYETDGGWDQQDLDEWWIVAEQEKCRNRFVRGKRKVIFFWSSGDRVRLRQYFVKQCDNNEDWVVKQWLIKSWAGADGLVHSISA